MTTKLLLIEDDETMRETTQELLSLEGFNVIVAKDGQEGLDKTHKHMPDLIICDIMMPIMNGHEVLKTVASSVQTSQIPFIFLSAKAEKSEIRDGMNLGADDYLTKPFEFEDLINTIQVRLKKAKAIQEHNIDNYNDFEKFLEKASQYQGLEGLKEKFSTYKVNSKAIIFKQDDKPEYVYFIKKGKVKIFQTEAQGKELIISIFNDGEFFGHNPVLQGHNYQNTAQAIEKLELVKIPVKDFFKLLTKNRDIAAHLIKTISKNLEERELALLSMAYGSVRKKTATLLLQLAKTDQHEQLTIKLRREDMASMIGIAAETLIRTLGEFKNEGLIDSQGRTLILKEKKLIQKLSSNN